MLRFYPRATCEPIYGSIGFLRDPELNPETKMGSRTSLRPNYLHPAAQRNLRIKMFALRRNHKCSESLVRFPVHGELTAMRHRLCNVVDFS